MQVPWLARAHVNCYGWSTPGSCRSAGPVFRTKGWGLAGARKCLLLIHNGHDVIIHDHPHQIYSVIRNNWHVWQTKSSTKVAELHRMVSFEMSIVNMPPQLWLWPGYSSHHRRLLGFGRGFTLRGFVGGWGDNLPACSCWALCFVFPSLGLMKKTHMSQTLSWHSKSRVLQHVHNYSTSLENQQNALDTHFAKTAQE